MEVAMFNYKEITQQEKSSCPYDLLKLLFCKQILLNFSCLLKCFLEDIYFLLESSSILHAEPLLCRYLPQVIHSFSNLTVPPHILKGGCLHTNHFMIVLLHQFGPSLHLLHLLDTCLLQVMTMLSLAILKYTMHCRDWCRCISFIVVSHNDLFESFWHLPLARLTCGLLSIGGSSNNF